jgi:hypothetical protein
MGSIIQRLNENTVQRDARREGAALLRKWEATGLLEGLEGNQDKSSVAVLLENQAKELLREASTMAGGDVEGFASVAFPIVRRVFGSIVANELVSVQPMSLPSGLIFFMDFTYTNTRLGGQVAGESIYGQGRVGQEITGGVLLSGVNGEKSLYALNNGYSMPTASLSAATTLLASGTVGEAATGSNRDVNDLVKYDPDLSGSVVAVATIPLSSLTSAGNEFHEDNLIAITPDSVSGAVGGVYGPYRPVRRATSFSGSAGTSNTILVVLEVVSGSHSKTDVATALDNISTFTVPIADNFDNGGALGSVVGADVWGLENDEGIPEIDIKVDSVAVTAVTRKLKAKWTPELGQDLNAYHNLDAEVELTAILSEHIEMEISAEILTDLVRGATAALRYWSRLPGKFVNPETGGDISATTAPPDFTGNVSEWYETLMERINDVSAVIHRKLRKGAANFLVCGPEVASILEMTRGFVGNVTVGDDKGDAGARNVGKINSKFDVYVLPYFFRHFILVGRKGSGFLESGYVYAPYVPMQMTPTIFGTEDFVPRKGVMTRYGKKMVRPDMYGIVWVMDLGSTSA